MPKGGFISPFKTTLRCYLGRTSWFRGRRMLILRMVLCRVSYCSAVGGFNILRTLAMEALGTLMVFTCLFSVNRWTRYSTRVTYEKSLYLNAFIIGPLGKGFPLRIINVTGRIPKRIGHHIHDSIWEVMLFEDISDKIHAATSNRQGSLWNWGRWMLGM